MHYQNHSIELYCVKIGFCKWTLQYVFFKLGSFLWVGQRSANKLNFILDIAIVSETIKKYKGNNKFLLIQEVLFKKLIYHEEYTNLLLKSS